MFTPSYHAKRFLVRIRNAMRWWPWATSVAVHLILLGALSAMVFISFETKKDRREIIPEARLGQVKPNLPLYQGQRRKKLLMPDSLLKKQVEKQIAPTADVAPLTEKELQLLDATRTKTTAPQLPTMHELATAAPKTKFFNAYGNAYSVIYVVDISPSMSEFLDPLKRELKLCLRQLKPMQKFHVIFFASGKPIEGPAKRLIWASDANKRKYRKFIDAVETDIRTDPRWAVKRALELNPDLIYLLTDGVFDEKLAKQIIEWSSARKIKINTVAYVNESGAIRLRNIAERTGGIYRFVSEGNLKW